MTAKQEKIAEWLRDESNSLHECYYSVLMLLADNAAPGRAQLICHACRDLCSGFQVLRSVSKSERSDTHSILLQIESIWRNEGLDSLAFNRNPSDESLGTSATGNVTVSPVLYAHLRRLMQEHQKGNVSQETQAAELFLGNDPDLQIRPESLYPLQRQWVDLRKWFQRYAHFGPHQSTPDEDELRRRIATLEDCILAVLNTFYEGMEELDDILAETNS